MADEIRVAIRTDADVVTARQEARTMGASLGFSSTDLTLLATAISEVARNITTYAGEGEVALRVLSDRAAGGASRSWRATRARASRTSSSRCRTATRPATGSGSGLPGTRRLVDDFELADHARQRARPIRLVKWTRA